MTPIGCKFLSASVHAGSPRGIELSESMQSTCIAIRLRLGGGSVDLVFALFSYGVLIKRGATRNRHTPKSFASQSAVNGCLTDGGLVFATTARLRSISLPKLDDLGTQSLLTATAFRLEGSGSSPSTPAPSARTPHLPFTFASSTYSCLRVVRWSDDILTERLRRCQAKNNRKVK